LLGCVQPHHRMYSQHYPSRQHLIGALIDHAEDKP
jgi:hypothetical protein